MDPAGGALDATRFTILEVDLCKADEVAGLEPATFIVAVNGRYDMLVDGFDDKGFMTCISAALGTRFAFDLATAEDADTTRAFEGSARLTVRT